jgi:hypothetical protein
MSIGMANGPSQILLKPRSDDARPNRVAFGRQVFFVKAVEIAWRRLTGRKQRRSHVDVAEPGIVRANFRNLSVGLPVLGPIGP